MTKMITPTLETERLILKRGTYNDFVDVYEYDMTRLRNINGEFEYIKQEPENLIGFDTYADEEDMCMDFIIYLKDKMKAIGNLTFDRFESNNKSIEISCNLHPNYWKNGYMTEAIIEAIKYIFKNYNINYIRYVYAEENIASKALSEKIGFNYSGSHITHYKRIDKDIKEIDKVIFRDDFLQKYDHNIKSK